MDDSKGKYDFDYIVIGSGFGGSVSAMRLSQKGYRVGVLEIGKRWYPADFPSTNWNIFKFIWKPMLFCRGICSVSFFRHFFHTGGTGVGGGSLVYGGNLQLPGEEFFKNAVIESLGGKKELLPFYKTAATMLGAASNPLLGVEDILLKKTSAEMGSEYTFKGCDSGIYFGEENKTADDPYFMGEGPKRKGCNFCGGCMTGCRYNAKNSLDKNYLFFAEKLGATVIPQTKAVGVIPIGNNGCDGYKIETKNTVSFSGFPKRTYTSKGIVFSGGAVGTVDLLLRMKNKGYLKNLSPGLGNYMRTNNNSFLSIHIPSAKNIDFSKGIAISSQVSPEPGTVIEAMKYSRGSDLLGFFASVFTDGESRFPRPLKFILNNIRKPFWFLKNFFPFGFAAHNLILLGMDSSDTYFNFNLRRRILFPFSFKLVSRKPQKKSIPPTYMPVLYEFGRRLARRSGGEPRSFLGEVLLNKPGTIHLMGGAVISENRREGVIDLENKAFGYENMYICDSSMIPANPGTNPSLTVAALTERCMAFIPSRNQARTTLYSFEKKMKIESWIRGTLRKK